MKKIIALMVYMTCSGLLFAYEPPNQPIDMALLNAESAFYGRVISVREVKRSGGYLNEMPPVVVQEAKVEIIKPFFGMEKAKGKYLTMKYYSSYPSEDLPPCIQEASFLVSETYIFTFNSGITGNNVEFQSDYYIGIDNAFLLGMEDFLSFEKDRKFETRDCYQGWYNAKITRDFVEKILRKREQNKSLDKEVEIRINRAVKQILEKEHKDETGKIRVYIWNRWGYLKLKLRYAPEAEVIFQFGDKWVSYRIILREEYGKELLKDTGYKVDEAVLEMDKEAIERLKSKKYIKMEITLG